MTYNRKDQNHEPQREIHTDRTDNHYEGPVPTTYPYPQSFSRLVQVPAVTPVEGFKGLKPLKPFAYPYPYPSKPLPLSEGKGFDG